MARAAALLLLGASITAMDYHVAPDGDDARDGTAPDRAWRTLARVSAAPLAAGDRVLLAGGATFAGPLVVDARHGGDPDRPLEIGSYGAGRAAIEAGAGDGVVVRDRGCAWIRDLEVRGAGVVANRGRGVLLSCGLDRRVPRVLVERVDVAGFRGGGIVVEASTPGGGFDGVRIRDCVAHANGEAGIASYGWIADGDEPRWAHRDLVVERCAAHGNRGIPDKTENHSGNGIVIGCVDGARIARCEAWDNGADCNASVGGPVGIWCWESRGVVIEWCASHHNATGPDSLDGGGFDLDGGAVDCVIRHCLSWANHGAGYLLCQYAGARPFRGCRVHHCVSIDDGRAHGYGALTTYGAADGDIRGCSVTRCTFVMRAGGAAAPPAAVRLAGRTQDVLIADNLILAEGCELVRADAETLAPTRVVGNAYGSRAIRFALARTTLDGLAAWRASGAEHEDDRPVGAEASGALGDVREPRAGSAVRGAVIEQMLAVAPRSPRDPQAAVRLACAVGTPERAVDGWAAELWSTDRWAGAFAPWDARERAEPSPATRLRRRADAAITFTSWDRIDVTAPVARDRVDRAAAAEALAALPAKRLIVVALAKDASIDGSWDAFLDECVAWLAGLGFRRVVVLDAAGNAHPTGQAVACDRVVPGGWDEAWTMTAAQPGPP